MPKPKKKLPPPRSSAKKILSRLKGKVSSLKPTMTGHGSVGGCSGSTTATAQTCCPNAVIFAERGNFFGFDDATNLVANQNQDEYWIDGGSPPQLGSLTEPSDPMTRDGSNWVSVGVGETITIEFEIIGTGVSNRVEFESKNTGTASVTKSSPQVITISGVSKGKATIIAKCDSNVIGWIHVSCYNRKNVRLAIVPINQKERKEVDEVLPSGETVKVTKYVAKNSVLTVPITRIQDKLNLVFKQAIVDAKATALDTYYTDLIESMFDSSGAITMTYFNTGVPTITSTAIYSLVRTAHPGYDYYVLWIPAPNRSGSEINGFVNAIGGDFFALLYEGAVEDTIAHELGHLLDLRHPNDSSGNSQYPPHLNDGATGNQNYDLDDKFNVMGYASPRSDRNDLRLLQWDTIHQ